MVNHTPLFVHDAHTHLSGSESGESADGILACFEEVGVQTAFLIAPLLDLKSWQITGEHLPDLRAHNDYAADVCSRAAERLLGFAVLDPNPGLANGSLAAAVDLMVEEARRCYHELGLRAIKMVPAGWYPNDPELVRLYRELETLGMFVLFHSGIFIDGAEGNFCRPAYFEALRQAPTLRVQLAHMGWPWLDEAVAVLEMETELHGQTPERWQFRADLSFGPPADWQLESFQKSLDSLPDRMLSYGSDVFWPMDAEKYREQYLQPQLGLFEVAVTNGHLMGEGSPQRQDARRHIFSENALDHYHLGIRQPQQPRRANHKISTPRAMRGTPSAP
jgi:predicted TIM-barrel fold metal-dependent hydrolase